MSTVRFRSRWPSRPSRGNWSVFGLVFGCRFGRLLRWLFGLGRFDFDDGGAAFLAERYLAPELATVEAIVLDGAIIETAESVTGALA